MYTIQRHGSYNAKYTYSNEFTLVGRQINMLIIGIPLTFHLVLWKGTSVPSFTGSHCFLHRINIIADNSPSPAW